MIPGALSAAVAGAGVGVLGGLLGLVGAEMGLGTVVGSVAGALVVRFVPGGAIKIILGCVLIGSALRVFRARGPAPSAHGEP